MEQTFDYKTKGTCSAKMRFVIDDDDTITDFDVIGGCPGNLQGIRALIIGMNAREVIMKLSNIRCGNKPTSCPDQIARALDAYLASKN